MGVALITTTLALTPTSARAASPQPEASALPEIDVALTTSDPGRATRERIALDSDLTAADGTTLAAAAARATIYTRTWSQQARGLFYFNWTEKHSGRIYWDGTRVWSTTAASGHKGSHTCNQGSGILYSIKVTRCSTEKIGSGVLKEWDYFQVHVVAHGVPIYASHSMAVRATNKGALS